MTAKIFRSIMAAAGGVLLACVIIIMGCLYDYFGGVQTQQLWDELALAAGGVEVSGEQYLDSLDTGSARLTWIAADGSVIYDAQADENIMGNHAQREEVKEAIDTGKGESIRFSNTLMEKTVYCAKRLSDGSVLRISVSTASMGMLAFGMVQPVCIVLLIVLLMAFILAKQLSKRIVDPINNIDLDNPLENKTYDELAPLLRRISQQRRQIDTQLRQLQQKRDEFTQITSNMNEGLVLLNEQGRIISINPAARKLFYVKEDVVGQDFLTVERSRKLNDAIILAKKEGHSEIIIERNTREYQVDMSRIESEGNTIGMVLLSFDVTEKNNAERTRREFSANVSHELKTPLTAILGSSEMIEGGMVKQEDIPRFVGHIHDEAARLLTLIEDIIRLSQLDENVELPWETVNLGEVTAQVAGQLQKKAEKSNVKLNVKIETCLVKGISRLVYEIAYNLIDNAIKYNIDGGSVDVTVNKTGVLTVTDTGIGIAQEHIDRVFERFYRVDKSHSKQIGGTGLGLSIVKHAASYLGAIIDLKSEPGKGTTVNIILKKGD